VDIAHNLGPIGILIYHNGLVTPPEKSTVAAVIEVETLSIESIQMPHDPREIPFRGPQTNMIVVSH
jgi:hypothetical protein|tara:strand:+ start:70 stop:267 length:198 start_codon:yes stop_codon:yes gene_type:complete